MTATSTRNGGGPLRLSAPPPDVVADVQPAAMALDADRRPPLRLSAPPPDVVADVQPAAMALDADRRPPLRLSAPPPDVVADVQPVSANGDRPAAQGLAAVPIDAAPYADDLDRAAMAEDDVAEPAPVALDAPAIYRVIREVAAPHSGDALYSHVAESEAGLRFGLVAFAQAGRHLGSALRLMRARDVATFDRIFGDAAQELLAVTGAADPAGRLTAVAGEPLTSPAWQARFAQAGEHPPFQAAQNEEAIEGQFRPMQALLQPLGFTTERTLAMAYDAVVARGLGAGARWVVGACSPLRTTRQREHALQVLGAPGLLAFQQGRGIDEDGPGPRTHVALVAALREQGTVPMPAPADLAGRLVAAADGAAVARLRRLRDSDQLADDPVRAG